MFTLYHANSRDTRGFCEPSMWKERRDEYIKVARVNCTLSQLFTATNHIDTDWRNNPEVVELFGDRHRSTSVGDVAVDETTGQAYMCASVGWDPC